MISFAGWSGGRVAGFVALERPARTKGQCEAYRAHRPSTNYSCS